MDSGWWLLGVILLGIHGAVGDVFTSVNHMKALLEAEPVAERLLETYVQEGNNRQLKDRVYTSLNHPDVSVAHPVDAFHLVKRWYLLSDLFPEGLKLIHEELEALEVPTYDDVVGAALALLRLQRTYAVSTEDMAAGKVYGHRSVDPLGPEDCYVLGEGGMETEDYGLAAQWFQMAVTKAQEQQEQEQQEQQGELQQEQQEQEQQQQQQEQEQQEQPGELQQEQEQQEQEQEEQQKQEKQEQEQEQQLSFSMSAAYFRLAAAQSLINDYKASLIAAQLAKAYDPHNSTIEAYVTNLRRGMAGGSMVQGHADMFTWTRATAYINYEKLCRGDPVSQVPTVVAPLTCRYKPGRRLPYVQYKEETLSLDPRISMFYDVISDADIDHVLTLAAPDLTRALVAGRGHSANRVGKLSWLWDFTNTKHMDGEWVKGLSERVGDITGLDTTYRSQASSAEAFQVVNYGIGGHYAPHHDYNRSNKSTIPGHLAESGDRITTFMFYLSHVIEGGATVFPDVGVRVPAIKGSAAFWYNANPTLDYNEKTLHAGCPVLVGEKWVANKWIRAHAQMFRRPCPTDRNAIWD